MATPSSIDIDKITAIIEWQWEGTTRTLTTGDPDHDAIRFTLHLDLPEHDDASRAHIEISIPFRFKDRPAGAGICLRINPFFIKSLNYSRLPNPPDVVKQTLDSTICLDFELDSNVTVLVPSDVKAPVAAARARSGKILDSLYELSCVTALRVYIQEPQLSVDDLKTVSEIVQRRQIQPSSNPDHDISRMFGSSGGKVAVINPPQPPSYKSATKLPPNAAPTTKRRRQDSLPDAFIKPNPSHNAASTLKRPRQDNHLDIFTQLWARLNELDVKVGELQADNASLRAENAQLKGKVTRLEKRHEDLEAQVAQTQDNGADTEEAALIEIRDDIDSLNDRVTSIEGARDEEFSEHVKEGVFDELAKRLFGG